MYIFHLVLEFLIFSNLDEMIYDASNGLQYILLTFCMHVDTDGFSDFLISKTKLFV